MNALALCDECGRLIPKANTTVPAAWFTDHRQRHACNRQCASLLLDRLGSWVLLSHDEAAA